MPTADRAGSRRSSHAGADLLLDTSAAVALVVTGHEWHTAARSETRGGRLGLAGHAWYETYSVLTRLPSGLRRSPADVVRLLAHDFPVSAFLDARAEAALRADIATLAIAGGSVYDALVGAAARAAGRPLLSGDRRAIRTYLALGVEVRLLG